MTDKQKIGILGGSFDPVHCGHLILAEQCREQANLDEVWWIPAATSPTKQEGSQASPRQRVEMVQMAIAGHDQFKLSTVEIERGSVSYTVETLETLHQQHPDFEWHLILGGDLVAEFPRWHNPQRICQLATPLIAPRPDHELSLEPLRPLVQSENQFQQIANSQVNAPLIDISSSRLRQAVAKEKTIRYLVPRAVEMYIHQHQLYCLD